MGHMSQSYSKSRLLDCPHKQISSASCSSPSCALMTLGTLSKRKSRKILIKVSVREHALTIIYFIRSTGKKSPLAEVKESGEKREGEIFREPDGSFSLITNEPKPRKLSFSHRVDGEIRPFSMIVTETSYEEEEEKSGKKVAEPEAHLRVILKIRDRMFFHNGKMYIISNVPEGKPTQHFLSGPKFISRLNGFPYSDLSMIDAITRSRAERRLRGTHVGEISGIGHIGEGYRITIDEVEDEGLKDIALPLAVASFLLNTTYQSSK